jgi:Xaa-Pro aminopeptidase
MIPASFSFYGDDRDVDTPIGQWNDLSFHDHRIVFSSGMAGRLKPGVTLSMAKADVRNLAAAYPEADAGIGATPVS